MKEEKNLQETDYDNIKNWIKSCANMIIDRLENNQCTPEELKTTQKVMMHVINPRMELKDASEFFKKPKHVLSNLVYRKCPEKDKPKHYRMMNFNAICKLLNKKQ